MATTIDNYDFQVYLDSIVQKYKGWLYLQALTDAEKKQIDVSLTAQLKSVWHSWEETHKIECLPVLQGMRKYATDHVLLVGQPGSGKSTALRRLLWQEASNCLCKEDAEKVIIPVLLELRFWQKNTGSVIQIIQKVFLENRLLLEKRKIEDLLLDGKLLLLFDGLNELPSDEESRQLLAKFREDFAQTPMIFTTCNWTVGNYFAIERQLFMQSLTSQQMYNFVQAYFPKESEEILQRLVDSLKTLGETPLILKMLCDVFDVAKQIPKSKGELFRSFVKLKRQVALSENLCEWKHKILQYIAFTMMQPQKPMDLRLIISRMEAEKVSLDFLKNSITSPNTIEKHTLTDLFKYNLIQIIDEETIQFYHLIIQEYYAAEYFLYIPPTLSDIELKRDYLNLLKWTETISLALILTDDEAQAIRLIKLAFEIDLDLGNILIENLKYGFLINVLDDKVELIRQSSLNKLFKYGLIYVDSGININNVPSPRTCLSLPYFDLNDIETRIKNLKQFISGIIIYTEEDIKLNNYIKKHFQEFHKITGDWSCIFVLEKPTETWMKENLSFFERLKVKLEKKPDKSQAYDIAKTLNLKISQMPCIVLFWNNSIKHTLIITLRENYIDNYATYFRTFFTELENFVRNKIIQIYNEKGYINTFDNFENILDEFNVFTQNIKLQNQYIYNSPSITFSGDIGTLNTGTVTNYGNQIGIQINQQP